MLIMILEISLGELESKLRNYEHGIEYRLIA